MKLTIDGQHYEFDMDRLLFSEMAFVQKKTGLKLQEWQRGLNEMDAFALAGLVYIVRKRAGEQPDWDTLDFDIASFDAEDDEAPEETGPKGVAPAA